MAFGEAVFGSRNKCWVLLLLLVLLCMGLERERERKSEKATVVVMVGLFCQSLFQMCQLFKKGEIVLEWKIREFMGVVVGCWNARILLARKEESSSASQIIRKKEQSTSRSS